MDLGPDFQEPWVSPGALQQEPVCSVPQGSSRAGWHDDDPDEAFEGGELLEPRLLGDPWAEPASRRVLEATAWAKLGSKVLGIRVNPLPVSSRGVTLDWLCRAPQEGVDEWRADDPHSGLALAAVERWLKGDYVRLASAVAAEFQIGPLLDGFLECLPSRAREALRHRAAGQTLMEVGDRLHVTRERIRQMEATAIERLASHVKALRAVRHPAILALLIKVEELSTQVLEAASASDGLLSPDSRDAWIRRVLTEEGAFALHVLASVSEETGPGLQASLNPLLHLGRPLNGGRTSLPWSDSDLEAVRIGFATATGSGESRVASLSRVAESGRTTEEAVKGLVRLAGLGLEGNWVFDQRAKTMNRRRAAIATLLEANQRAMHEAELCVQLLLREDGDDLGVRQVHIALSADPHTFVSDGTACWQLRAVLGDHVEDRRPGHPETPEPMPAGELLNALAGLGRMPKRAVLADLCPTDPRFPLGAGQALADALTVSPEGERRSLGQIVHAEDAAKLLSWLRVTRGLDEASSGDVGPTRRNLESLALVAAFTAAVRSAADSDEGYWPAIAAACGPEASPGLFNSQGAPKRETLSRFVEAATAFSLRQTFSFNSDPWSCFLGVQAGLLKADLDGLPSWLRGAVPVSIRQLVAPGPNFSSSMACTWNALRAYRQGSISRDAIATLAQYSEWWPGWSVEEVCRKCLEPAPASSWRPQPRDRVPFVQAHAPESRAPAEAGGPTDRTSVPVLGAELSAGGHGFTFSLPSSLPLEPGPIALLTSGIRVGGLVSDGRKVTWHSSAATASVPLRGAPERQVILERGDVAVAETKLRLWAADDYIAAFPLGGGQAFDPLLCPMPRKRGIGLLLHRSLQLSTHADQEHGLDDKYALHVFASGVPDGTTVSCEGETVWAAEPPGEGRRILSEILLHLALDGASGRWGARTDLCLRNVPLNFIPHRAVVGGQRLAAEPDGAGWRFRGYELLPGMDSLRRRGRVEGFLAGERVSAPAAVSLGYAPVGSAAHDGQEWRPLEPTAAFRTGRDGTCRIWVSLPQVEDADWIVFEGARPALAYQAHGVRPGTHLLGLGEPLHLQPRRFNLNGTGVTVADLVTDTGIIVHADRGERDIVLRPATAFEWTDAHRARAWSGDGFHDLERVPDAGGQLRFAAPGEDVEGICLFNGGARLGAWCFREDGPGMADLMSHEALWPEALEFAISARLPVSAPSGRNAILARLQAGGGKALTKICQAPRDAAGAHLVGRLLTSWAPSPKLAEALCDQVLRLIREETGSPGCSRG